MEEMCSAASGCCCYCYALCYHLKGLLGFFFCPDAIELGPWKASQVQGFIALYTALCMYDYTAYRMGYGVLEEGC